MAYKCKVCGYRFGKDDGDLCPNCFTARDDREDFSNTGRSGGGFEGDDFLANELKRENTRTPQEISGSINRAADQTIKNIRTVQNDRRYQSAQSSIGTNNSFGKYKSTSANLEVQYVKAKKVSKIIKLIVILAILSPIAKAAISMHKFVSKNQEKADRAQVVEAEPQDSFEIPPTSQKYSYDYSASGNIFLSSMESLGDSSIMIKCGEQIFDDHDLNGNEMHYRLDLQDLNLDDETLLYSFTLVDEDGIRLNIEPMYCSIYGLDANDCQCYCYENYTGEMLVRLNPTVQHYSLCAVYEDPYGNQQSSVFMFTLDDFLGSANQS